MMRFTLLMLVFILAACRPKDPFVDTVSSVSYQWVEGKDNLGLWLSFFREDFAFRLNESRGFRPESDALTAATFTHVKTVTSNQAVYSNARGHYLGIIILNQQTIQRTAARDNAESLDFSQPVTTYER